MTELANLGDNKSPEGVLALAEQIYQEHVSNGKEKHDLLVSEAEEKANEILAEAQENASKLLSEAEKVHAEKTEQATIDAENLVKEASVQLHEQLAQIQLLQAFEAEYRKNLQNMIDMASSILDVGKSESNIEEEPDLLVDSSLAPVEESTEESNSVDNIVVENDSTLSESSVSEDGTDEEESDDENISSKTYDLS